MAENTFDIVGSERELFAAASAQDTYDLKTINLIAPASPTKPEYCDDLPLRHNPIIEGLLGRRPYAGADSCNRIEQVAVDAAKSLFSADHANVQPHSVSQANQAVYDALLKPGDNVLAMRFDAGGHLTHGLAKNFSGKQYNFYFYGLTPEGLVDYDQMNDLARENTPQLIVCGASSYPRFFDFERIAEIADSVGARVLADLSHPAGFVAAKRFPPPFPACDVVTLTPDKTMLGGHGGLILCKEYLKDDIDAAVHPGAQSSIPMRRIFGLARCLLDAHKPEFANFIDRVYANMKVIEHTFAENGGVMITGGSDTHLMVIDTLSPYGLTGKAAEVALEEARILTNRQVIPGDKKPPYIGSGVRLGTTWSTARGFDQCEMKEVADAMIKVLHKPTSRIIKEVGDRMLALCQVPRELDVWASYL